jgi:hypothetical protein
MKNGWKWILGISLSIIIAFIALSFAWRLFLPYGGYGMMGYGYGWNMPMMVGGFGMMTFGMLLMWLIPIGLLVLIGLGIAWLVKAQNPPKS